MKKVKHYSRSAFTCFIIIFLFLSANTLAQNPKMVAIKGTDQLKFSVENIQATPGQKITVKLTNESKFPAVSMSHNFVLLKQSADAEVFDKAGLTHAKNGYMDPKLKDQVIAHTSMAGGGQTVEVTFEAPIKPGEYMYICTFPGHYGAGMKGILTVK